VNLAVDRINDIEILKIPFKKNTEINYKDYFEDFIGVTKTTGEPVKIEFAVHPKRYKYLATKPLHQTQKLFRQNENGWFHSSINLIPNKELYAQLLSYGADLKVLAPENIQDELRRLIAQMNRLYN
jgi:predicted DNA-binding transcriptional regulator YafY